MRKPRRSYVRRPRVRRVSRKTYRSKKIAKVQSFTLTRKLPYCTQVTLNAAPGNYTYHTFLTNSLYDPDLTGAGHQPLGFDQYSPLYKNYYVPKSSIRVKFLPYYVADLVPCVMTVIVSKDPTPPTFTDIDHFMEISKQQGWRVRTIGGFSNATGTQSYNLVSAGWNAYRGFGPRADKALQLGTPSTSPSSVNYYHLIVYSIQGNDPPIMNFQVEIQYTAIFQNQTMLPES